MTILPIMIAVLAMGVVLAKVAGATLQRQYLAQLARREATPVAPVQGANGGSGSSADK